ncbi:MAG: hypothetical protein K1W12_03235 [Turicimonas muris]
MKEGRNLNQIQENILEISDLLTADLADELKHNLLGVDEAYQISRMVSECMGALTRLDTLIVDIYAS